ncbi:tubulin polyglutamylase TTLL4 isoform X2 [Drosophila hydei]|uniref:Tubulin polyglutamylase TTLL4 isoform X2 n=1 Tax=Drosophila hydei TaxID=7224 RepID=A0A6J1L905_DROHY|nr:tubulin polyglutamylase TTLL4 isoform X2 [Drosophila hydei]
MFMYNASEVYGKSPEMHQSNQFLNDNGINTSNNRNHNNNNSNSNVINEHNLRHCNNDNAFTYFKNGSVFGPVWNLKSPSRASNRSPSKNTKVSRQINKTYYSVPGTEQVPYSNAYPNSFASRKTTTTTTTANNNSHVYQPLRLQPTEYYKAPVQQKARHGYGHSNSAPNNHDLAHYTQASLEKDQLKRQLTARSTCEYLDDASTYSHSHRAPGLEQSWDNTISDGPGFQSADQHYEHYFSYFYNRGPEKSHKSKTNTIRTYQPQMSLVQETTSKRSSRRPVAHNDNNQNIEYDSYLLKENSELPFGYNDSDWIDFPIDRLEKSSIKLINAKDVYEPKSPNDELFNESTQRRCVKLGDIHEITNKGESVTVKSNLTKKTLKANEPLPLPRLPLTPKRIRGGQASAKKALPTVHRVLLYNSQSPRSARQSAVADQLTSYIVEDQDEKGHEFRDADFDNDDDLDNISNFDESETVSISSDTEDGYRAHAYKLAHSGERFLSPSKESSTLLFSRSSDDDLRNPESVLVSSLFPYVPPYLSFSSNTKKGPSVPPELHRILKWRVTSIMPKVVRLILANSGMRMLKKTNDWMGVWGKHLKSPCFKTIRSYQKINHLPGSFRIGRKDSCWKNLQRQMRKHSNREFGFMPRTYVIPNDLCALRKRWPKYAQRNTKWIIKPPASARGAGIRVVHRWGQIPKRRPLIVQKYIERPLLINGSKFDLRLYVLVTSVNPLRVFMYHNGLARFASVKYSAKADTLNDRCMHLTNYSINKFSSNYSKNEDVNACHGHKWTIKSLWTYLANRGVRTDGLWEALRSLVLRTILAGENGINNMIRANVESKYSCFELFGFDVILDSDLVPWLLEVNISPSLHSELPLDAHVKAPLVQGVLNTALYNIPPKLSQEKQRELAAEFSFPAGTQMCYDKRMYINYLSREEKNKHNTFTRKSIENREEYIDAILDKLTPDDVRCLIIAEDELARCSPLERIFPTDQTYKYLKYNDTPRYYNRLLDAWESRYANNRTEGIALLRDYCQIKYHLEVPAPPAKKDLNVSTVETIIKNAMVEREGTPDA